MGADPALESSAVTYYRRLKIAGVCPAAYLSHPARGVRALLPPDPGRPRPQVRAVHRQYAVSAGLQRLAPYHVPGQAGLGIVGAA